MLALAHAGSVPVAIRTLDPGTPVRAEDLRWVDLPGDHPLAADALNDPVGHIVIEAVLEGEILRAERLLDVDKPERIAVPGMRAFRVPGLLPDLDLSRTRRADLWAVQGEKACTLAQGTWILGLGRLMGGTPASLVILLSPEQALEATEVSMTTPLQVRPVSPATAARPRPEIACSP